MPLTPSWCPWRHQLCPWRHSGAPWASSRVPPLVAHTSLSRHIQCARPEAASGPGALAAGLTSPPHLAPRPQFDPCVQIRTWRRRPSEAIRGHQRPSSRGHHPDSILIRPNTYSKPFTTRRPSPPGASTAMRWQVSSLPPSRCMLAPPRLTEPPSFSAADPTATRELSCWKASTRDFDFA